MPTEVPKTAPRRKLFYRFLDYRQKMSKADQWISMIEEYIPVTKFMDLLTTFVAVKLAVDHRSWYWILTGLMIYAGYKIVWEALRLAISILYFKSGMWRAEIDWGFKNTKYNTYQTEMMDTINEIAKKTGAKSYFKELENE